MKHTRISRREFIGGLTVAGAFARRVLGRENIGAKIDRQALVSRHDPILHKFEPLSPLSVGNGEFAFTCDVTGLQTFPELYNDAVPLCTMSQWGWHTKPKTASLEGKEFKPTEYDSYGRKVPYITGKAGQEELFDYLRENPHRLHLGQIGFRLLRADGREANPTEIEQIEQKLDLWTGVITSRFSLEGKSVSVRTAVHPTLDQLAVSVQSELMRSEKLSIRFAFPYGSSNMQGADWNSSSDKHTSKIIDRSRNGVVIERTLDADRYGIEINWEGLAEFTSENPHQFLLTSKAGKQLDFVVHFAKTRQKTSLRKYIATITASETHWRAFWTNGGAIDLSGNVDPQAKELERRVVLSQYLTAIQCSGSTPPQETGLTCNSWYGKFHLEMHWWHAAHFALWNRFPMLEKSLDWYSKLLPSARERATEQGYDGVRWAKMTAPDGRDSPSPIGPLLIWQQPHPIFYAELAYLNRPTAATLEKYQTIVHETAAFMASYAHFDEKTNRYILGPPVIPAQENHPARETWNPTFELEYWHFGLKTAQKWRERMGMNGIAKWNDVIKKLSLLPAKDGVYLAHENCPETFTQRNKDHPSMLGALGILSGEKVHRETMRRTLKKVMKEWDWPETWGWDYPMVAMTAARLGEPAIAIDALLLDTPKNHYAVNGHNYQRPNLPLYLPGNGGLLYAVALMANGWKGASRPNAPGFPRSWKVRAEGFASEVFREI